MNYIIKLEKSPLKSKRFRAFLNNDKHVDFGLKNGKTFIDEFDKSKRDAYIARHMASKKEAALIKSMTISPALLSMYILWGDKDLVTNTLKLNKLLIAKSKSIKGGAISDIRLGFRPYGIEMLDKYGDEQIVGLEVRRDPIEASVRTLLNAVSFGGFDKAVRKAGYDKMFHLYLVIRLVNGGALLIEKNAVVELSNRIRRHQRTERKQVPLNNIIISTKQLIDNAKRDMGDMKFFAYDAFNNNCQNFISMLLSSSGLLTPDINAFIKQDAVSLLKHMPGYIQGLARGLTNIAAVADKFIYGSGMKVQTVLIDKGFNHDDAMKYLDKYGFIKDPDEKGEYIHYRQRDPKQFKQLRTWQTETPGIKLVVGDII